MRNSFNIALGFFTRLPVKKMEFTEEGYTKALKFVPLTGLVIGAILVLFALLFLALQLPAMIKGALLTGIYIFLTGGLHMDGLADSCDGLFSGKTREQALEIMKDSRIGVFGTIGIFMTGLFYFVFLSEITFTAIFVFPVCGRFCCLVSASLAQYAREDGLGKLTVTGAPKAVMPGIITLICTALLTMPLNIFIFMLGINMKFYQMFIPPILALSASGAAILFTITLTGLIKKRLGGITGDTLGGVIEASSILFLLIFITLFKVIPM